MIWQALEAREKILGVQHPHTLICKLEGSRRGASRIEIEGSMRQLRLYWLNKLYGRVKRLLGVKGIQIYWIVFSDQKEGLRDHHQQAEEMERRALDRRENILGHGIKSELWAISS